VRKGILSSALALGLLAGIVPAAHAAMSWSPASHDFGTQEAGISSTPVTFTLTATCDADNGMGICVLPAHPYGAVDAPGNDFNTDANTCTLAALSTPMSMGAGSTASCTIKVSFKPSSSGPKTGALVTSDASAPDVPLSGNGVDQDELARQALLKKCKKKKYRKKHRKKCRKARRG
jgi:hypothetical protein